MLGYNKEESPLEKLQKQYDMLLNEALGLTSKNFSEAQRKHIEAERIASKIDEFLKKKK